MKKAMFTLIFSIALIACNKNDDDGGTIDPISQLPPETMTGENTFGFLLNGEPINATNTNNLVAIYQRGLLQFGGGIAINQEDISVSITLEDLIEINTIYNLSDFPRYTAKLRKRKPNLICDYTITETYQGSVAFTRIDRVNYIISGTFEFSTTNENCGDVDITEGRFDLQYIP
ncbi:MAG: hypothetical protein WBG46_10950 [Nonlabens sp.]